MTNRPKIPSVDSQKNALFTGFFRGTITFEVTDTAQQIVVPEDFTRLGIENPEENADPIFVGGPDVQNDSVALASGQTRGRKLKPGQNRDEDTVLAPYVIAPAGKTVVIVVEFAE